jgi:hypothetical protein
VGRNAAIKRFDPTPGGQPMDLFGAADGRDPVLVEILGSPWIARASDLPAGPGTGKRAEIPVEVEWDGGTGAPSAFVRQGRRFRVEVVVQRWSVDRYWWDRSRAVSRRCFRVLAGGGTWDLAYDRTGATWLLVGVLD